MNAMKASVIEFCSAVGTDSLLVQGAGGNVSWKDDDTLWVKASGIWLADANEKDIFVPVDLKHLRSTIEIGDFSVTPRLHAESALRPSIETILHALMPHRVVVHLHAIEVLAYLVRDTCRSDFQTLFDAKIQWAMIDYHKPGTELAAAVGAALAQNPNSDVIFLKNHGVVIGGADIAEVRSTLYMLITELHSSPISILSNSVLDRTAALDQSIQYASIQDVEVNQLAINVDLFKRLDTDWALYPDHVVFLGARAFTYKTWDEFFEENDTKLEQPELVFILGHGVFVRPTFNKAKHAQLRCYYDVISRQNTQSKICPLTRVQIAELLNWDAEQYRMSLSK